MSEYEVTTHVECSMRELPANLGRFARVLTDLDAAAPSVQEWLTRIGWPQAEFDFVVGGTPTALHALILDGRPMIATPDVLGYAPSTFKRPTSPWLQCSLVFKYSSDLVEPEIGGDRKYRPDFGKPIYRAMRAFAEGFPESPIFFNDSPTVNRPWDALLGEDGNLWAFDLALAPTRLAPRFADFPAGYARADLPDGIALAPISHWSVLPWSEGE